MQCVEQKMWIQLHLQGLELGLGQALLQFRRPEFALPVFPVIIEGLAHRDNHPVDEQVEMPGLYQQRLEGLRISGLTLPLADPGADGHIRQRKQCAANRVHRQAPAPRPGFEPKAPRQPSDRHRQQRERIPITQGIADGLLPGHLQAGFGAGNVKLACEGQAQ